MVAVVGPGIRVPAGAEGRPGDRPRAYGRAWECCGRHRTRGRTVPAALSPGADAFWAIISLPPSSLQAASVTSASPLAADAAAGERLPDFLPAFFDRFLPLGEVLGVLSAAMLPAAVQREAGREGAGRRWAAGAGVQRTASRRHA